jgi:putative nucleotidyltransferase with HDIG domain
MGYGDLSVKMDDLIDMIIITLDARDPYTYAHSERVAALSILIASAMGIPDDDVERLHIAAHLHDIGKIGVPDLVLNKEGRLSREEIVQMQSHSRIGSNILDKIDLFKDISAIVLHHHERWDGKGYPEGLEAEGIPIESRIIAVADSFDAITSDRPYRAGSGYREGVDELKRHSGEQFCPLVVEAFTRVEDRISACLDGIQRTTARHMAFVGHEDLIHSRRVL